MKPIFQTKFGKPDGNCTAACLASLLDLDIDTIPDFTTQGDSWITAFNEWLAPGGLALLWIELPNRFVIPPDTYYMLWGISPRDIEHSVIGYNGEMVHDPHPDGGGLKKIEHYAFLVATFNVDKQE